jgi:IS5 family transposase
MAADQGSGYEHYRKPTRRDEFLQDHECHRAVGGTVRSHRTALPQGRQRAPAHRSGAHVAHPLHPALVQPGRPGLRGGALRQRQSAPLRGNRSGREPVPDATTLLKFRKLLNEHKLGEALFAKVGQELQARGFKVNTGTIVDATIIGAPSSTKNADKARDPEMHQTRKGQQWYFGMKLHIGVDSQLGMAHSAVVTAANVHDKHPCPICCTATSSASTATRLRQPEGADRGQGAQGPGLHEPAHPPRRHR